MTKEIFALAKEIAECRDNEIPYKLLKLKDILKSEYDHSKIKYDIYKYDILEAVAISFKNEYGYIKDGWNLAVELVKIFRICTTDFGTVDKSYQETFLPNATENILVLAKKLQDKHIKSKAYSEEHLTQFKTVMQEYSKINSNNTLILLKSLSSQRLFKLLLTDEQNTATILINTLKNMFMIKKSSITKLSDKTLHLILNEVIYKMVSCDLKETGLAIFQLLNTLLMLDPTLARLLVKNFKGLQGIVKKWQNKDIDKEVAEFNKVWSGAYKARASNQNLDDKAAMIQKTWRGHMERKRLKKANKSFAKFQQNYRARRELEEKFKQQKMAKDELRFQLVLEHRRKQRQKKMEMLELLEILPADQIENYLEKQRQYSATVIQAFYRGYRVRKDFNKNRVQIIQTKAATKIQRAVRRWIERNKQKRQTPAFYSRPPGLNSERREFLFDKIRKHLESLPPHPRTAKEFTELHEKSQRAFQNYVFNQRSMRMQQQNTEFLLAMANNDAELILNCPKLSQVTEDDINNYYSHKSTPVMLAGKEAHKAMLKKQRAKWYELLDDSDSDYDESYDKDFEELTTSIKNLNFNAITENYYKNKENKLNIKASNIGSKYSDAFQLHQSVSRRQKNQLKTNNLRKSVTKMMNSNPDRSCIWNVELNSAK